MKTVDVQTLDSQLLRLLEEAQVTAEKIIFEKGGQIIGSFVPEPKPTRNPRTPGRSKGQIQYSEDFDAPMSEEELKLWYGGELPPLEKP